jgi:hypothetical protein
MWWTYILGREWQLYSLLRKAAVQTGPAVFPQSFCVTGIQWLTQKCNTVDNEEGIVER